MASITTRAAKGTPLTHAEVDANFTNLNADKLDVAGIAAGTAASPTVKFTGDTNTGIYSPGADQVAISTNGTGRLFVDASGNVGVGAASPSAPITFGKSTYGSFDAEAFYRIKFQDAGGIANDVGIGQQDSNSLGFNISAGGHFAFYGGASNGERLRITSAGQVRLAGAGITFNGDTATANELDDYEEGTWLPSVGGNATYHNRNGAYTKIGRTVFLFGNIEINALGTGSTQFVSGLPFAANGGGTGFCSYFAGLAVNVYSLSPAVWWAPSTSEIGFLAQRELDGATTTGSQAVFQNGTRIDFCLIYTV